MIRNFSENKVNKSQFIEYKKFYIQTRAHLCFFLVVLSPFYGDSGKPQMSSKQRSLKKKKDINILQKWEYDCEATGC